MIIINNNFYILINYDIGNTVCIIKIYIMKYEFFGEIDTFLSLEGQLNIETDVETEAHFCSTLQIKSNNDAQLASTCKSFVKLFKISKHECGKDFSKYGNKCTEFINYWINDKLSSITKYEDVITPFYNQLQTRYKEFDIHDIFKEKIYYIKQETYKNMNILYKLYKIFDEIKESTIKNDNNIEKFKNNYNKALNQCFRETDDNFYNA
ncbi:hypothetical protein PVMG_05590 [Plasmodium vivax Mauritania I]|uniref:Variable surface protein n=1 Tax=Plasmodium vivax Mauritania I TaxID=1035515 RepID=A0A0J9W3Z9_PLAVI|nr:hypothetical protein PVMG_05590 [Plasmodium vivax Mauritania I]